VLVAHEADSPQTQLSVLLDVEVDRHRVRRDRLDLVAHLGEVVTLGAIERLDARAVFVQQGKIQRRAGRQRQRVADLLAIDRVVSGDGDLAHDRILFDLEGDEPAVGGFGGEDAHVPEEAQRVHLPHVPRDLLGAVRVPGPRRDTRADRVGLDAPIASHLHVRNAAQGFLHGRLRGLERRLRDQLEGDRHAGVERFDRERG
jgi:hypothetical protein